MRIVIADDDMLVSGALRTILEKDQDIEVQGIASNGKEAIELYRKYEPDVLLMDIRMSPMSGLEASEEILKEKPEGKSAFDYETYEITEKERAVMKLVADGKSNKEIAGEMFLSEGTIRNYISGILDKLNLRDRTQLAVFYLRNCT